MCTRESIFYQVREVTRYMNCTGKVKNRDATYMYMNPWKQDSLLMMKQELVSWEKTDTLNETSMLSLQMYTANKKHRNFGCLISFPSPNIGKLQTIGCNISHQIRHCRFFIWVSIVTKTKLVNNWYFCIVIKGLN